MHQTAAYGAYHPAAQLNASPSVASNDSGASNCSENRDESNRFSPHQFYNGSSPDAHLQRFQAAGILQQQQQHQQQFAHQQPPIFPYYNPQQGYAADAMSVLYPKWNGCSVDKAYCVPPTDYLYPNCQLDEDDGSKRAFVADAVKPIALPYAHNPHAVRNAIRHDLAAEASAKGSHGCNPAIAAFTADPLTTTTTTTPTQVKVKSKRGRKRKLPITGDESEGCAQSLTSRVDGCSEPKKAREEAAEGPQKLGGGASLLSEEEAAVKHRANMRERRRTQNLNEAFESLRGQIPTSHNDKCTKFHTLMLASKYIDFLEKIINFDSDCDYSDLKPGEKIRVLQNAVRGMFKLRTRQMLDDTEKLPYCFNIWRLDMTTN